MTFSYFRDDFDRGEGRWFEGENEVRESFFYFLNLPYLRSIFRVYIRMIYNLDALRGGRWFYRPHFFFYAILFFCKQIWKLEDGISKKILKFYYKEDRINLWDWGEMKGVILAFGIEGFGRFVKKKPILERMRAIKILFYIDIYKTKLLIFWLQDWTARKMRFDRSILIFLRRRYLLSF